MNSRIINRFFLVIFLSTFSMSLFSKVLIITHSYNRPDFIEIQHKTFQKFMLDEYEFVVFSDAKSEAMNNEIMAACAGCNIRCIRAPQEIHTRPYLPRDPGDPLDRPNIRHANVVQYSMDILGFDHDGPVFVLDSDIFMTRPLSIVKELKDYDIVASMRGADNNVLYLWPGFMIFAMDKLPNKKTMNFNCGKADGQSVDSGGHSHYYLKNNPEIRVKCENEIFSYNLFCPDRFASHLVDTKTPVPMQILKLKELKFNEKEINFIQKKPHTISFLCKHSFMHYRAGSNYDNQSVQYEKQKLMLINEFLDDILGESFESK